MKIKLKKAIIPILLTGTTILVVGSRVGKVKNANQIVSNEVNNNIVEYDEDEIQLADINEIEEVENNPEEKNKIEEIENSSEEENKIENNEIVNEEQKIVENAQEEKAAKQTPKQEKKELKQEAKQENTQSKTEPEKNSSVEEPSVTVTNVPAEEYMSASTSEVNNKPVEEPSIKQEEKTTVSNYYGLELENKKVVQATTGVNIRSAASTDSNKLGLLSAGNSLELQYQENDDWYKVKYNEQDAYISTKYSKIVEKQTFKTPIQKMIYFKKDSDLYQDESLTGIKQKVPYLEAAPVYSEYNDLYVVTINGEPGLVKKGNTEELDGTYVIVDISDQTATLYEGPNAILSTPVVTGKPSTPTTKGLHHIYHISSDRYLEGDGYKSWVHVFLAFHNGEGLHDAEYHTDYNSNGKAIRSYGWRNYNSFGGNIYKTSGSHGCVNMRHDDAQTFYNNLKMNDKVLVKE